MVNDYPKCERCNGTGLIHRKTWEPATWFQKLFWLWLCDLCPACSGLGEVLPAVYTNKKRPTPPPPPPKKYL